MKQIPIRKLSLEAEAARDLISEFRDELDNDFLSIADFVEGETNLIETIQSVYEIVDDDEMLIEMLSSRIQEMQTRKARIEARATRLREAIAAAMETAGQTQIVLPEATLSRRKTPPKVIVTDESKLTPDYLIEQSPKVNKKKLLTDLKNGMQISGATLSNGGETLSVRKG